MDLKLEDESFPSNKEGLWPLQRCPEPPNCFFVKFWASERDEHWPNEYSSLPRADFICSIERIWT
jgi:hypothetical protein